MSKVTFEYSALNDLAAEFIQMDEKLKAEIKEVADTIGAELKTNTEAALVSHKTKEPKHGTYFYDDVKLKVKTNDKRASITVNGGKATGRLWFAVDNGHVAQNGKFVAGLNFTDQAYGWTDVSGPVDDLVDRILNNG